MAVTDSNVLKLAPDAGTPAYRSAPHNIEAEQSLLGAILVNNDAFYRVSDSCFRCAREWRFIAALLPKNPRTPQSKNNLSPWP